MLVGDVVLHSGVLIDGELDSLVNWAAESSVILSGILVVGVILWVVDVVLWTVAAKTLGGDLELLGSVSAGSCIRS